MPFIVDKSSVTKVCVDDFALRKRFSYGTVMVDLGHRIIDLIPSRETADVAKWLATFPNIEVVSRDGASTYASAATDSMYIRTPCRISLVGENGAGKNTLIKLLLRLYRPTDGIITLDDKNINEYSDLEYSAIISAIFQDFNLFAFTVEENIISFNKVESDPGYFNKVATQTEVSDFIREKPYGFRTYISNAYEDEGVDFSGGELQKIALARTFYKNALFYVLDEPTAAYDADAEYKLYQKYEELFEGKTSIFISHRLSSCKLSDRVILLQNGSVAEDGIHDELMRKGGICKHMFEIQSRQYQNGGTTYDPESL